MAPHPPEAAQPSVIVEPERSTSTSTVAQHTWDVVVWNDPVTPMSVVVVVFRRIFGYSTGRCTQLMLRVHHEGRAVVWSGRRERAEEYCVRVQVAGLRCTIEVTA